MPADLDGGIFPEAEDVAEGFARKKADEVLDKLEKKAPSAYGFVMFGLLLIPTLFFLNLASWTGGGWIVVTLLFGAAAIYNLIKGIRGMS